MRGRRGRIRKAKIRLWRSKVMAQCGIYGVFHVPPRKFAQVNVADCISGSGGGVKYLCANQEETKHLRSIGLLAREECDYYKVVRV